MATMRTAKKPNIKCLKGHGPYALPKRRFCCALNMHELVDEYIIYSGQ